MKHSLLKKTLLCAAFSGWASAALAAGLTVAPATITNDYAGKITLTITGLASGKTVLVEKYGDLNTNGVIDAGEPVMQAGLITDGTLPTIGGVRNLNVPGDEDGAANGQVRMELFYPGTDKGLDVIAGKYLAKVSDPASGFAPVTASCEVKQKVFPQGVNGRITASVTGAPLANAMVVMMPPDGYPVAGAVTDANGNYTLYSPPGNYVVLPLKSGYVGDFNNMVTVNASTFATLNLALPAATRTISGKLKASSSAVGIPGIFIQVQSTSGQFVSAFSQSDGTYTVGVLAGSWELEPSSGSLAQLGYLGWDKGTNVNATSGNVANLDLPVDQAAALIYGRVKDSQNNPVIGVDIWTDDQNQQYDTSGRSFPPNADYCVGVRPGSWWVGPDSDALAALGYIGQGTNVTVTANQAIRVDFVLWQANAHLIGRVVDSTGAPVGNISFYAEDQQGSHISTDTDANGNFDLGVFGGTWYLNISPDDAQQRGYITTNLIVTVANGETRSNITFVAQRATAHLRGRLVDNTGAGVGNIQFGAGEWTQSLFFWGRTDDNGYFDFGVIAGSWRLDISSEEEQARGVLGPDLPAFNVVSGTDQNNVLVVAQRTAYQVSGNVRDANGNPITSLPMWHSATVNGTNYSGYTLTDGTGNYRLGVFNGSWHLELACGGNQGLQSRGYRCAESVQTNVGDANVAINFVVRSADSLEITTTSLPDGGVGTPYSQQLQATGGQQPYNWSLVSGSLPPGLGLSSNGSISGSPNAVGTNGFTVRLTDFANRTVDQILTLIITSGFGTGQWYDRAFMSTGRSHAGTAVLDGKIYVVGGSPDGWLSGLSSVEVYDPALGQWEDRASMPIAGSSPSPVVGAINGLLYVAGYNSLAVYNPQSNTWTNRHAMNATRSYACGGVISNKFYLAGGGSDPFNTLEVYDPATDIWTVLAPMPTPRSMAAAVVVSNLLFVVGGYNSLQGGVSLNTVEIYNPQTDSWSTGPSLPRAGRFAAAVSDGKGYFLGGGPSFNESNFLMIFDPVSNSWSDGPPIPSPRNDLSAAAVGGKVFALGGWFYRGGMPMSMPKVEHFSLLATDRVNAVVFRSDATTQAAGLSRGAPSLAVFNRLDADDVSGLTFSPAQVGGSGLDTVGGAVTNADFVQIPPGDGQNGFFKTAFVLPDSFAAPQLSLTVNADHYGRAFLNGHPLTSSMWNNDTQRVTSQTHTFYTARNAAWFKSGTNEFIVADVNYDGAGSSATFYGFVTYRMVPHLRLPTWAGPGQLQLQVDSVTNETYAVQFSTNLADWTTLFTTNVAGSSFQFIDPSATNRTRFYRVGVIH